jgi:iron complex outermembrane receptor protein
MPRAAACLAAGVWMFGLFAFPHSSLAQQPNSAESADDGAHLEEIVVTARRRSEKLETVPISVTLFSADDLREHAIETIADLQRLVPTMVALNVTNRDSDQLSIRGLPGVVAYFAEAPVVSALAAAESGTGSGSGASLYYDLQGVEVLKGPQSTLFGGTTTGGAILFEPRRPTKDFEGYVDLTLGDYNNHMVEGAVNVPIVSDKLMVRFAGQMQMRDGFTENIVDHKDLDNKNYYAARIGVTFRPSDDFDNYFVYSSYYSDTNGTGEHLNAVNPNGFALLAYGPALTQALALETALGPWKTTLDVPEIGKEYTFGFNDIAQYFATDELTIRNIAAYTESKYLFRWDLDGSPLPIVGSTSPTNWSDNLGAYSEELQVQGSPPNGAIQWTAGMFLQFVHPIGYSYVQSIEFETPVNTVIQNPLTAAGRTTTREQAIYGQLTYDLGDLVPAISGLKFTGGYRYTWDYASNVQDDYNGLGQCEANTLISVPHCSSEVSGYFRQGTWTAGLDYQLNASSLVYVSARRGYDPGGFNTYAPSPDLRSYQPEHLTDFEVGSKSKWTLWGMPWRATANGFYDHFTNIQRNVAVVGGPNSGNPGISTITENAAVATLEGLEFEGKLVPIKSIELSASYAYANSRYDKYLSPTAGDLSGLPFTGGPRNQYSATGKYYLPVADRLGSMSLSATYSWQGHIQFSDREVGGIIPPHGLLDVRADWNDIAGRPVDLAFYMTNATDQVYIAGGTVVYNALGVNPVIYGEPRMWGFQLRYRFGPNTDQDF